MPALDLDDIGYEVADPVAVITLNRPDKLNALTYPMLAGLRRAVTAAASDTAVVGIVITGAGRGFCSGLDAEVLGATAAQGSRGRPAPSEDLPGLFSWFLGIGKPIIAAVNGPAAGGGFVLAAMADLRFASSDAWFTTVFSKRGLVAEHGTSWILPRLLGPGRALDLLWSSRRVDAEEAYRLGLVERLTEPAELLPAARDYIVELAGSTSPASLRDTKQLVYRHCGLGYDEALRDVERVQWEAMDRIDAREGASALIERRSPSFPRLGS